MKGRIRMGRYLYAKLQYISLEPFRPNILWLEGGGWWWWIPVPVCTQSSSSLSLAAAAAPDHPAAIQTPQSRILLHLTTASCHLVFVTSCECNF